jgi:hypothetical protein
MSKASDLARLVTSGSTAIHGEAGVTSSGSTGATTNLQQGLKKVWINFNGSGTIATRDSFNVTSITDDTTGRYTVTIANDMSNTNYSGIAGGCFDLTDADDTQARQGPAVNNFATGSIQSHCGSNTYSPNDWTIVTVEISGDLA